MVACPEPVEGQVAFIRFVLGDETTSYGLAYPVGIVLLGVYWEQAMGPDDAGTTLMAFTLAFSTLLWNTRFSVPSDTVTGKVRSYALSALSS